MSACGVKSETLYSVYWICVHHNLIKSWTPTDSQGYECCFSNCTYIFIILELFPLEYNLFRFNHKTRNGPWKCWYKIHLTWLQLCYCAHNISFHILPPIFLLYAGFMIDGFTDQKDQTTRCCQFWVNALKKAADEATAFIKKAIYGSGSCVNVSYSSPQSRSLPQTPSDNEVAYSIMGVNTNVSVGGGRVESVDESVGYGINMRLKLNVCERGKSSTTLSVDTWVARHQ